MRKTSLRKAILYVCGLLMVLVALVILTPYYFCRLAPGTDSNPVRSPDGRYQAYTNSKGFLDTHNVTLWLRDAHGTRKEICSGVYTGEIKWSPDSRRVAIVFPIRKDSTMFWYSIADVGSRRYVSDVAQMESMSQI